jgi:hypothetical protein
MLYHVRKRKSENVSYTPLLWADLDECPPDKLSVEPTLYWETSTGRWQAVWLLSEPVEPSYADALSKGIADAHKRYGCDTHGGLGKYLRIPGTLNFKRDGQDA